MTVITVPNRNITMVAFYGNKKPTELSQFIDVVIDQVHSVLAALELPSDVFTPYRKPQMHATLIGMEVIKVGGELCNANFLNNNGQLRPIKPNSMLDLIAAIAASRRPLFTIRFGGFRKSYCTCTGFDLYDWKCTSSNSEFHAFHRSAYEGTFYAFSPGPVLLTGWPIKESGSLNQMSRHIYGFRWAVENCGFLDKYHSAEKPYWKDDDFYLRLGTFRECPAPKFESFVERMRDYLCLRKPITLDVNLENVSIVYYESPLLEKVIEEISLVDALKEPQLVEALYDRWRNEN